MVDKQSSLESVSVRQDDFDVSTENAALMSDRFDAGALVNFVGYVRNSNEGDHVSTLFLEHYPGMTEKSIAGIIDQARSRWEIYGCKVIHRVGELAAGEQIVYVGVCSAHRGDSFQACEFIMDYLKTEAPFWKKEQTPEGERWVDARSSDDDARNRW